MVGAGKTLGRKFFEELVSAFRVSESFRKNAILRSNFPCLKKHMACCKKYKPCILKYKALILKYVPYIFWLSKKLVFSKVKKPFFER